MSDVSTTCVEVIFRVINLSYESEHDFHSGCQNVSRRPTTVLRNTSTRTIDQPQTLTHLGHNQQQSFSGLHVHQPGRSSKHKHGLTWVTTKNSPSRNYTNPDDQPTTNIDFLGSNLSLSSILIWFPDINECLEIPGVCSDGRCENQSPGFVCHCPDGYKYDSSTGKCVGK